MAITLTSGDLSDMQVIIDKLNDLRDSGLLHEGRFETSCSIDIAVKFNMDTDEYELGIIDG